MKKLLIPFFLCAFFSLSAQEKFTITGTVKDSKTGETLIGVSIIEKNLSRGTASNEYGFYSFTLNKGKHDLEISYIGYDTFNTTIDLTKNTTLNINLTENVESLNEIVISSYTEKVSVKKAEMSVNKMKVETIKSIPAVLGEVDVIKSITTLPGVTTAGEGQSGFNVRGGAADQNLVLLDESTIYNTSHLFGLFSVINADAIKHLKLYKGGTPAKFGGRISSVLDIQQKDGNKNEFQGNGGIGLISSRLTLEGPIKKEKASFFLSGRRSYADLFIPLVLPDNDNTAYFYDLNTKINWEVDEKNKLYLSGYFGRDIFSLSSSFINRYGSTVGNLRWNHVFNPQLFSNLSLIYSNYYYGLELDFVGFEWDSGLDNIDIQYDFTKYFNDDVKLNFGANALIYNFSPGEIKPNKPDSTIEQNKIATKNAIENGAYIDVEHKINENLDLRYGLKLSYFARLGQKEINIYENDEPVVYDRDLKVYDGAEAIGQKEISKNKIQKSFFNLEPRFSAAYALNNSTSFKASYQRMTQYVHLISNAQSPAPLDIWTPSGEHIKPQISDQIGLGFFKDFRGNYSLSAEVYGKTVKNRLDYIDGAELVAQEFIETQILAGKTRAYGLELMFKKEKGKFNGWISYTLSKSEQKTAGRTAEEIGINNGNWYKTPYDKTHDISVVAMYKATKKWNFNANFSFQTGQPVTYPTYGSYEFRELTVPAFGDRNTNRLPAYHRLDVAATYKPKRLQEGKFKGEWVFSVYNIYNRANWSSVLFGNTDKPNLNSTERLSIFGILPSVAFNFKF